MEKEHAVSGSSMYLQEEQRAQSVTASKTTRQQAERAKMCVFGCPLYHHANLVNTTAVAQETVGRVNHGAIEKTKTSAGPECDQIMKTMLPILAVVIVMAVVVPILAFAVYDVPHPIA